MDVSAIGTMPALKNLPDADVLAIAEYIHSVMGQAGRQGRPPERETPFELNVLVGDASAARCISHGRAADVTRRAAIFRALPRA